VSEQEFQTAPLSKRIFAALIDCGLIPSFVTLVIGVFFMFNAAVIGRILVLLFSLGWFSAKDLMFEGAAPGKKIFGLRVVSLATGQKMTLSQGFLRNVLLIFPFVAFVGYPLELILLIVKGERLGDRWAKTKVVCV